MKIYPAIDLHDGNCVRLLQGDYNKVTKYNENPIEVSNDFINKGAKLIHVVDLDGAKEGVSKNDEAIKLILSTNAKIEVGGGIRSLSDIAKKLDMGVSRVILGSIAVKDISIVKEAINIYGNEKIVVGVDAYNGDIMINGWLENTNVNALEFCHELEKIGCKYVIYTDISKDGMMMGPNFMETKNIIDNTNLCVIASGGISKYDDLLKLEEIGAYGAVLGKSLYTNALNLEEIINRFEE